MGGGNEITADLVIKTKDELIAFEQAVNAGNTFAGKTVALAADIDLSGVEWKPIGNLKSYPSITFAGEFDGHNHTISNMTTNDALAEHATAGLFGSAKNATIKNLTLNNVTVTSTHFAAAICGYHSEGTLDIENCKVLNGTITSTPELVGGKYNNGDKVGGIVGYTVANANIKNCSVESVTITAYRDLGGIAGCTSGKVDTCTVKDCTIQQDNTNGYKQSVTTFAAIVGRNLGVESNLTNNTETNVTVKSIN